MLWSRLSDLVILRPERITAGARDYNREIWIFSSPNSRMLEKCTAVGENA